MTAPLAAYRQAFDTTWSDDTPIDQVRFVILDSETSGLNAEVDPIIDSILIPSIIVDN